MRTTTQGGAVCPPPADITPCHCEEYSGTAADGIRLSLDCSNQFLADSKVSSMLDSFLRPGISPLGKIDLTLNRLTTVPDQIRQFPKLDFVSLFNNEILSIQPNSFNFLTTLKWLYIDSNKLETIASGAFQGKKIKCVYINCFS
jgi:Leucine-rich repeat (LRR) protein